MIAIIAAYDRNRTIGRDGHLPWHIPGELRRFRELTEGSAIVMGRRTYAGIGHPLPGRRNIVLSRDPNFDAPGCLVARSLREAIDLAGELDVYVSGGADIYAQALPLAQVLYLTEIDAVYPGDAFFPDFDASAYVKTLVSEHSGPVAYRYYTYERIASSGEM